MWHRSLGTMGTGGRIRKLKRTFAEIAAHRCTYNAAWRRAHVAASGKTFVEKMKTLAKEILDAEEVVNLLREARDERLKTAGVSKITALQPRDVDAVLQQVITWIDRRKLMRADGSPYRSIYYGVYHSYVCL